MVRAPIVTSELKAIEYGTSCARDVIRVEPMVRVQWDGGPAVCGVVAVHQHEAFHVVKRVTFRASHQPLSVPGESLKFRVNHSYPSHLITPKKFHNYVP